MTATTTCKCGAVYEVDYRSSPFRDKDYFDCEVCGTRLDEWNSTAYPIYKLVGRPEYDKPD